MSRSEEGASSGLPDCPDLQQHVEGEHSPSTPWFTISASSRKSVPSSLPACASGRPWSPRRSRGSPAGCSPGAPDPPPPRRCLYRASSAVVREAAPTGPGRPQGSPGVSRSPRWPRPSPRSVPAGAAPSRTALRRRPRHPCPQPARSSPHTGLRGLQVLEAGAGHCARETRLLRSPGTRLKPTSPARSTLQGASGVSQQAQPSSLPKLNPRERGMKDAAKGGSGEQPSSRLPTKIPSQASRSSLQPPSKRFCLDKESTTEELVLNRTRELKEDDEGKERLVAASIVLGAGQNQQTLELVGSSLSSELDPGLTSGREDPVPGEQSAGAQLTQELERLKKDLEHTMKEMERVKERIDLELGICQKDAAAFQQQ